jgi:hypothetical protein
MELQEKANEVKSHNDGLQKFKYTESHKDSMVNPRWLKIIQWTFLAVLALAVILLAIVWAPCFLSRCDGLGEAIFTFFILLPIAAVFLGFWLFGLLINLLINKRQKVAANIIPGVLLVASIISTVVILSQEGWHPIGGGYSAAFFLIISLPILGAAYSIWMFFVINR